MVRGALKPDICTYPIDDPPDGGKIDFSKMDLFIELKSEKSYDPFVGDGEEADEHFPSEKHADASRLNRGQLALMLLLSQGLSFAFTLSALLCARAT